MKQKIAELDELVPIWKVKENENNKTGIFGPDYVFINHKGNRYAAMPVKKVLEYWLNAEQPEGKCPNCGYTGKLQQQYKVQCPECYHEDYEEVFVKEKQK